MVGVGDGDGERVGRVGALDLHARKQALDHKVDLRFLRRAGADDGFLDEARGIFADGEPGAGGGHQDDTARLGELERRLRVLVEEYFLGGCAVGVVIGEDGVELRGEVGQALGQGFAGAGLELAVGEVREGSRPKMIISA